MADTNYKKVALLSNFTLKGLDKYLKESTRQYGITIDVYNGEYGQWQQEILGNELYDFNPDIVFLILDVLPVASEVCSYIEKLSKETSAKIVISNAVKPYHTVFGISGMLNNNFADEFNQELVGRYKNNNQVFVFDFDGWLGAIGKSEFWNTKYRYLGDMRISPKAFPALADELVAYLIPLAAKTKKCLVLDLDNTLWGGIIGEDGLGGIKLSPTGAGAAFYDFQKVIKDLKNRGIILAINSSNNEGDVKEVFIKHSHMVLQEDDFAAVRINWRNKAQNMKELAEELNIGLDSFAFIDDDPRNREFIQKIMPEVDVIDLPKDTSEYVKTLLSYKGFSSFGVTDEDRQRAEMYAQEKKRRQFKERAVDLDSFLRGLEISIIIQPVSDALIPRAAQLTQKTNQFNLTTKRYQDEDIKRFMAAGARLWAVDVVDKFGEYGTTGLIIICDKEGRWEIDTLLLSCRVLGKRIEEQFVGTVLNELKKTKPQKVIGHFLATAKNFQVKDFYNKLGFQKKDNADKGEVWEINLSQFECKPLDFINTQVKSYG